MSSGFLPTISLCLFFSRTSPTNTTTTESPSPHLHRTLHLSLSLICNPETPNNRSSSPQTNLSPVRCSDKNQSRRRRLESHGHEGPRHRTPEQQQTAALPQPEFILSILVVGIGPYAVPIHPLHSCRKQMSSAKKNISSGSGRSKPRLVKRRPLRSHTGKFPVAEAYLSSSLPQFAEDDSAGINGAPPPESDRLEKFRNFLFSASKPFSNANLNLEDNKGSVFGDTLHPNFKPEAKGFSDEGWKSTIFQSGISTNVGFVFGANNSGSIKWNELGIKLGDNRSDLVSETATEPKASSTIADGKENKFKEFSNGECRLRENMESRQECDGARSSGDFGAGRKTQADTEAELLKEKTNNVFVFASSVNTTGSSRRSTSCKLSESMKKLNIDGCESIGLGNNKYPFADSSGSSSPKLFVFQASPSKGSDELDDGPKLNKNSTPPIFSSTKTDFKVPSTGGVENKEKFSFGSIPAGGRGTTLDFGTLETDSSSSFTFNANSSVSKTMEFGKRRSSTRGKKWTKAREKPKQQNTDSKHSGRNPMSKEGSQNYESTGCYSPMDFSPNQDGNCAPLNMKTTCSTSAEFDYSKADTVADLSKKDMEDKEKNKEVTDVNCGRCVTSNCNCDWIGTNSDVRSNTNKGEGQSGDRFRFSASAEDGTDINVTFSLSTAHGSSPVKNRRNRKKYRMRVGCSPNHTRTGEMDRLASTVGASSHGSSSLHVNHSRNKDAGIFNPEKLSTDKGYERRGAIPTNQESCEKWRIKGNNAYKKGFMSKAEEFYTKGINSIPQCEVSACAEVLVLCYSNRAAALMSGGRIREALKDCKTAAALDPKFVKVQIRAANCHLALGETEKAVQCFRNCLESNSGICLDRRITIEAANGLQRAEKVTECIDNCSVILEEKTSDAAIRALDMISAVLPLCPYSEKLLELKGETLLMLRRFEDVIRFCKQTLVSSEKNFHNNSVDNTSLKLWKWRLMAKSYFHLGKLEASLDLLDKEVQLKAAGPSNANHEASIALQVTVRELLRRKNAGNEAFQSGRYTEAVENYTAALSSSMVSRPFAAVCFCNRAAAHQAAGQIVDAIADCSSAIAFDGSYSKALSRRASLHETIRDYGQAASDLQRLISLLESVTQEKLLQSGTPDGSTCSNGKELRQARIRLLSVEKKAKKEIFLNHYLILGIKSSDTASEIKKAYRKAALRHHPDKAGQALPRSESGDDGRIWKEIAEEVQKDADRLFKMIGEAYAVLSDPAKRSKYDLQDELRNSRKETNASGGGPSDFHSSSYDSWGTRRYWH